MRVPRRSFHVRSDATDRFEELRDRRQRVAFLHLIDQLDAAGVRGDLCVNSGCAGRGRDSASGIVRSVRAAIKAVVSRGTRSFWPGATFAVTHR